MVIGEAPGQAEDKIGRPFVGPSGKELNRILELNGLDRNEIYVTNICKERPPFINGKQLPPSKEEIERDEHELIEELLRVRPSWICALGRVATRWLTGRDDLDMEAGWGLAFNLGVRVREMVRDGWNDICTGDGNYERVPSDWLSTCYVIPSYHPAAGLRNVELSKFVWRGLEIYARYTKGELHPVVPVDRIPDPSYSRVRTLEMPLSFQVQGGIVACDTEGLPGRVWGGSVSREPGTASVFGVRETRTFGRVINGDTQHQAHGHVGCCDGGPPHGTCPAYHPPSKVVFHNSLHDVPILEEIGIPVDWAKIEDTFLMAYCLCLVPMGLKPLSRRFCGMKMQSYLDVIAPADRKLAFEYVQQALDSKQCQTCNGTGKVLVLRKDGKGYKKNPEKCPDCIDGGMWPERDPQLKYDWDNGTWKTTKGWSVGRYLLNIRKDMEAGKYEIEDEETGEPLNVRRRIKNWPDDVVDILEKTIGPLPEPTLDDIDPDAATYYSARDADATIRVYPILKEQIEELELTEAYKLDLSVIPVAAEMQKNGMPIDKEYFRRFVKELEYDNDKLLARLESICRRPINPCSGDQVAGLLFGDQRLKISADDIRRYSPVDVELVPDKWTKMRTRAAVDDKVLEALKLKHAENKELVGLIDLILDYRIRDKILGTYARKLPEMATWQNAEDGTGYWAVHTTIKPCRTATFRWASADPNLQNIPTRPKNNVDLGKKVRAGFIAPPGYILGSWDFDQIEKRVLAWYSQDETMLSIFRDGPTCPNIGKYPGDGDKCRCHDMHYIVASKTFRVPFDEISKDQRVSAKNIGFGIDYGVTPVGLKAQMELKGQKWTEEECFDLINTYLFVVYPGVGKFMMEAHAEARRYGYVRSLFGHIRYVPGVHSAIPSVREEALRQAANFKIQATAAEILKESMRCLWTEYKPVLDSVGSKLLMAVHDELLLMVRDTPEAREITDSVVTASMTNPVWLEGVQIGTTGKYDKCWANLK